MAPQFTRYLLLVGTLFVSNIFGENSTNTVTGPTKRAEYAFYGLGQWYNTSTGIWETAGWWNSANIMTTVGNLALADPDNAHLQKLARRTFANALCRAPAKNPDPDRESPSNRTSTSSRTAKPGTPYNKWLDPKTYQPHSSYPPNWSHHMTQHIDNTAQLVNDPKFDEAILLNNFHPDPYDWVDGYYDDDLWWALAWIKAYDVTQHDIYLSLAEGIFSIVSDGWSTNCGGGGIYWSDERTYVNAIANELFFSTAAYLATRCSNSAFYASWATRSLTWFLGTGMINTEGTINDGLNATCQNNNGDVWSYNQGVILGGLVQLNRAAPDPSYLALATRIASAALANLSDATGVIHDPCEATDCGADGTQFKGVLMRNLVELQKEVGGFDDALKVNADSIWTKDRDEEEGGSVFGVNWAGPYEGVANASLQGSAIDGLVAGIGVGGY